RWSPGLALVEGSARERTARAGRLNGMALPCPVRPAPGHLSLSGPGPTSPSTERRDMADKIRLDKPAAVAELTERFRSSSATLLTAYRGLTVAQITNLRRTLGRDTTYAVAKNTLAKRAA